MKELVVISGKGGTGKTSVLASFAALAGNSVIADCDVDAADLHLVLSPEIERRVVFAGGREAVIVPQRCTNCGVCAEVCRFGAIISPDSSEDGSKHRVDPLACEGCGVCVHFCPEHAIEFPENTTGEWFVSNTRFGPMVHARLGIAAENSGKLVSTVRREAAKIVDDTGRDLLLVDGPPGIGCPVIASITGASAVLVVTEPTLSGEHDLARVLALTRHFRIPAAVCVNKWDINPDMAERIETGAEASGALIVGRIPYDRAVTTAQVKGVSVVQLGRSPASEAIKRVWDAVKGGLLSRSQSS